MLKHIDHRPVPRGTSKWLDSVGRKKYPASFAAEMRQYDVFQYGEHNLNKATGPAPTVLRGAWPACADQQEIDFLDFKSVDEHDDGWPDTKHDGKWCKPVFWHWVLRGEFTLYVGSQKKTFKKGDIFVMDMNKKHRVEATKLCTTMVATVPKKSYRGVPVYKEKK